MTARVRRLEREVIDAALEFESAEAADERNRHSGGYLHHRRKLITARTRFRLAVDKLREAVTEDRCKASNEGKK